MSFYDQPRRTPLDRPSAVFTAVSRALAPSPTQCTSSAVRFPVFICDAFCSHTAFPRCHEPKAFTSDSPMAGRFFFRCWRALANSARRTAWAGLRLNPFIHSALKKMGDSRHVPHSHQRHGRPAAPRTSLRAAHCPPRAQHVRPLRAKPHSRSSSSPDLASFVCRASVARRLSRP